MDTIKILHIGNLCLLPGQTFAQHALLASRAPLPLPADYLVVCGNITGDGSEAAFDEALKAINSIFEQFTPRDYKENRLVIVPGKLDVKLGPNGEPDYTNFKHFLSKVYGRPLLPGDKLDPATLTVRDTLDLTLISLPGVDVLATGENKKTVFEKLKPQIEQIGQRCPDYLNRTPNVLVSAVPPIRVYRGEFDNAAPDLTELFHSLRINVHLVGCAPRLVLPPADPFGNDPWCVSCDLMPANAGEPPRTNVSWPLRMNLIELPRTAATRPQVGAQVWHMKQRERGDSWETRRTLLAIEEDTGQLPSMEKVYESLVESLITTLKRQKRLRGILVQGLPGCGLQKLHQWLQNREYLNGDVPVFSWSWKGEEDPEFPWEKIGDWITHIPSNSLAVVTVWDPDLVSGDSEAHEERCEALDGFHNLVSTEHPNLKVLHLSHHTARGLDAEGFECVDVKALDSDAVETLKALYALKVPVDAEQVNLFTGGYQGFTQGVLDYAHRQVASWRGAREVNAKTPWQLICASWSDDEIKKDFLRFVRRVCNQGNQWQVFDRIRRELLASKPKDTGNVEIDLTDLRTRRNWDLVLSLLRVLERFQIIEFTSFPCFRVRVVAPFLCQPLYRLFLSYEGFMNTKATEFAEELQRHATANLKRLEISDYRNYEDNDPVLREEQNLQALLDEEMKNVQIFCVYHSGRPSIESKWVQHELKFWQTRHGGKNLIVVAHKPGADGHPLELRAYKIIDAGEKDTVTNVLKVLSTEEFDWSFWQEKIESFV